MLHKYEVVHAGLLTHMVQQKPGRDRPDFGKPARISRSG